MNFLLRLLKIMAKASFRMVAAPFAVVISLGLIAGKFFFDLLASAPSAVSGLISTLKYHVVDKNIFGGYGNYRTAFEEIKYPFKRLFSELKKLRYDLSEFVFGSLEEESNKFEEESNNNEMGNAEAFDYVAVETAKRVANMIWSQMPSFSYGSKNTNSRADDTVRENQTVLSNRI